MNAEIIVIPFDERLLPATTLHTSQMHCIYEHGRIRYLEYGGTEVIRMIYFAVRDEHWNTAPYTIENEVVETTENGFSIVYTSLHTLKDINYRADVTIKAEAHQISFVVAGEALSSFRKNRIGICVLHPLQEHKAREVTITTQNRAEYSAIFPRLIAPHQPFKEVKRMHYTIHDRLSMDLNFEGDIFETEDQRNWADSSYKTYSTPLEIPFPVNILQGERLEQKLELRLAGGTATKKDEVKISATRNPFPEIGYSCNTSEQLSDVDIAMLSQIPFDHYRVEFHFESTGWKEQLLIRSEEARRLNTRIEAVLFFTDDYESELVSFLQATIAANARIVSVLALHSRHAIAPPAFMDRVYSEIKSIQPDIEVGWGTDRFFADINRNRPTSTNFDFVSFSLNPQVHASDSRSLLENLQHQSDLVETARSFAPGKKVHISPITFKIRSPVNPGKGLPADYDSRQHNGFGAWWTLSAIKNLGQADRLTFYDAKGYRGIIYDEKAGSTPSPLYTMLKAIKAFNPGWIIEDRPDETIFPTSIVLENEQGKRLELMLNKKAVEDILPLPQR